MFKLLSETCGRRKSPQIAGFYNTLAYLEVIYGYVRWNC